MKNQRKRRFGSKLNVNGPLYLTILAAVLIMMEPMRHALQDSGVWREASVVHVSDVRGVDMSYDAVRHVLLLPDTQTIGATADEDLFRVHRLQYENGKVVKVLPSIDNLTMAPNSIYWDTNTDAYYIGVKGYIAKYDPKNETLNNSWCKLGSDEAMTLGMTSDTLTLYAAGGGDSVLVTCKLSDGATGALDLGSVTNQSYINDVAYDSSSSSLYVTFGSNTHSNSPSNNTVTPSPSGVLQVELSGKITVVVGDGDRGITNANSIILDGVWIVVTTNPGSRVYNIDKSSREILSYTDISDFTNPNFMGLAMVESGHYLIATNNTEVVDFDFNFLGSGEYKHNPSVNCISSNNEQIRCLSGIGIFSTLICTYIGFLCLAVGTMWNANLCGKLRDARDKWRELRA